MTHSRLHVGMFKYNVDFTYSLIETVLNSVAYRLSRRCLISTKINVLVVNHDQISFTRLIVIVCHPQYKALLLWEFGRNIFEPMVIVRRFVPVMAIVKSLIHLPARGSTLGVVQMVSAQSQCLANKSRLRHRTSIPDTL